MSRRNSPRRIALCGVLTALMLTLGYVEHLIPVSSALPGVKLGLSNGVLIFALYMLDTPTAFALMALKVILSGALYAGFGAAPYALCGGALSLIVMALARRTKGVTPVTVSMLGGAAHNMGQTALAMLITRTPGLIGYMGLLMLIGLVCGLLTGVCAALVMKHLHSLRL
ncbi:MAG: Gx transporter family protein [Clostridia bacterium]|nr:Gx transporter family protein [Clostridia bacterium]